MIDPASFTALRRARESAQSVEPTPYDAPPGEPDIYTPEDYPPGFGPSAQLPARQFHIQGLVLTVAAGLTRFSVPWHADYFIVALDNSAAGVDLKVYTSPAVTANHVALIGARGRAKIPCNELTPPEYWLLATGATAVGVIAFIRGCEYENVY